ncbi:hypothetical protein AB0K51_31280 [Kitasatospora sp. NPDC049285]|uniref:hypothetical protein n=1 Tax=Kitasatospora sp. NPDC049285 TaxID=3157096 RepID=UPI00341DDBBD
MSEPGLTEDQLRERFHRAVAAVQPDPAALPRLRAAVPRRRVRRRRAWSGAAVLAAAVITLPVVHAAQPFNLSGDSTGGSVGAADHDRPPHPGGIRSDAPHRPSPGPQTGHGGGTDPSASPAASGTPTGLPVTLPACTRTDLGRADARQAAAEPDTGRLYGWFQLTNTGGRLCRVADPGVFTVGGAAGVQLTAHIAGDPAASLPDPAVLPAELLLAPGDSYLVRFAWVPQRCAAASPAPSGPSGPLPSAAASTAAAQPAADPAPGSSLAPGVDPSPSASPTPSASPSPSPAATGFALGYAPDTASGPAATTALRGDCGGTVYRSGPERTPAGPTASATPAP